MLPQQSESNSTVQSSREQELLSTLRKFDVNVVGHMALSFVDCEWQWVILVKIADIVWYLLM